MVFEQRTESDKNLDVLADTKARCDMNVATGRCCASQCGRCTVRAKLDACYQRLAVCDQLRVDMRSHDYGGYYYWRHVCYRARMAGGVLGILVIIAMIAAPFLIHIWH